MQLHKGEAIFLAANIPHAYLSGEGVECMACSDNVVRAGLTPKFKDVSVLISMLDYSMRSADDNKLKPLVINQNLTEYKPTVDEFSVQQIRTSPGENMVDLPAKNTASILIVVENSFDDESRFENETGRFEARPGLVYFIEPNVNASFYGTFNSQNNSSFLAYRAFIDIKS